jgi:hypothetical protein
VAIRSDRPDLPSFRFLWVSALLSQIASSSSSSSSLPTGSLPPPSPSLRPTPSPRHPSSLEPRLPVASQTRTLRAAFPEEGWSGWRRARWRPRGSRSSAAGAAPCSGRRPSSRATTSPDARTSASPRTSTARPITDR